MAPLLLPHAAFAAAAAAGVDPSKGDPGAVPWDGRAWFGAALYLLLFLAALAGVWRLARGAAGGGGKP